MYGADKLTVDLEEDLSPVPAVQLIPCCTIYTRVYQNLEEPRGVPAKTYCTSSIVARYAVYLQMYFLPTSIYVLAESGPVSYV